MSGGKKPPQKKQKYPEGVYAHEVHAFQTFCRLDGFRLVSLVKILGIALGMPVFFVELDRVAEVEIDLLDVFVAQSTPHGELTSLSWEK
jgi:hypothetical protein